MLDDKQKDPTSLGAILQRFGVASCDIEKAKNFLRTHPDSLLGEALVSMATIDRSMLEMALAQQVLERSSGGTAVERSQAALAVIENATRHTQETTIRFGNCVASIAAITLSSMGHT